MTIIELKHLSHNNFEFKPKFGQTHDVHFCMMHQIYCYVTNYTFKQIHKYLFQTRMNIVGYSIRSLRF